MTTINEQLNYSNSARQYAEKRKAHARALREELCTCLSSSLDANEHAVHCEFYKRTAVPKR